MVEAITTTVLTDVRLVTHIGTWRSEQGRRSDRRDGSS
jgi:hypothetical protein